MKKLIKISVEVRVEDPELRKTIRRILKPVLSVGSGHGSCKLCGTETSWTINNHFVCPSCHVLYGFASKDRIPDPCKVCGRQGEWCTEGDPIHSLCFTHRDSWFRWEKPELKNIDSKKDREKWIGAWDMCWARFVACMKVK